MLRILSLLLAATTATAFAQSTTVTASNLRMGGVPIVSGKVSIQPQDSFGRPLAFSGADGSFNSPDPFTATVTNGALPAGFTVPDQALSVATTANTPLWYGVTVSNAVTKTSFSYTLPPGTITGSTFALDTYKTTQFAGALTGTINATALPSSLWCSTGSRIVLGNGANITGLYECYFGSMRQVPMGGGSGVSPTFQVGTVSTGAAAVQVVAGANNVYTLNFVLPQGLQGQTGQAGTTPSFSVGTVTTGPAGSSAAVSVDPSSTPVNIKLNFTIPQGVAGQNGTGGSGTTIALKVNGVNNSSQSVLNLIPGTNVSLSDTGSGGITVSLTGLAPSATTDTTNASNILSGTTSSVVNPAIPANNINVTAAPYFASPYGATTTTTSASVASGATSVPVTSASTFVVGNGVLVTGGGSTGWTGSDYIGTVTAVSGNTLTVTPALSANAASGAVVKHDDSAALNAISTFCKTSDCGVYYPPIPGTSTGTYRINGPILDTSYSNAMIVLPNAPLAGGTGTSFRMYSSTRPESTANAVTIQSDYAGSGAVSIFGAKVNGGAYGGFNNTYVSLSNLRFSSGNGPNQHIFECGFCKGFTTDGHIWVMAASGNTGIGYPVISNDVDISSDTVTVLNMTNAVRPGEHTYIKALHGANNTCAVTPDSLTTNSGVTGHANSVTIGNLWNQVSTNLVCGGTTPQNVAIQSADAEVVQNISNDPNNMLTGYVNYHVPYNDGRTSQTITGAPNVVGSTKLRLVNLDTGACYGSTCPTTGSSGVSSVSSNWLLNEGSGTSAANKGNGPALTLTNPSWNSTGLVFAGATGSTQQVAVPATATSQYNFANSQAFSVCFGLTPANNNQYPRFVGTENYANSTAGGTGGFEIGMQGSAVFFELAGTGGYNGNDSFSMTAGSLAAGTRVPVCVVYNGTPNQSVVYVNGSSVSATVARNNLSTSIAQGNPLTIGRIAGDTTDAQLSGTLDHLVIVNKAMTSSDVATYGSNPGTVF